MSHPYVKVIRFGKIGNAIWFQSHNKYYFFVINLKTFQCVAVNRREIGRDCMAYGLNDSIGSHQVVSPRVSYVRKTCNLIVSVKRWVFVQSVRKQGQID